MRSGKARIRDGHGRFLYDSSHTVYFDDHRGLRMAWPDRDGTPEPATLSRAVRELIQRQPKFSPIAPKRRATAKDAAGNVVCEVLFDVSVCPYCNETGVGRDTPGMYFLSRPRKCYACEGSGRAVTFREAAEATA